MEEHTVHDSPPQPVWLHTVGAPKQLFFLTTNEVKDDMKTVDGKAANISRMKLGEEENLEKQPKNSYTARDPSRDIRTLTARTQWRHYLSVSVCRFYSVNNYLYCSESGGGVSRNLIFWIWLL